MTRGDEYFESEILFFMKQLITTLNWLHERNLAHLDLEVSYDKKNLLFNKFITSCFQPENLLIDVSNENNPILKLVDFGDCVTVKKTSVLQPAFLEFASPELVLGQPVGLHTDCWAVGVLLYVSLSGVSPFLDDSIEETTANILKCDYCFPEEYFANTSTDSKDLIRELLVNNPLDRKGMQYCLESSWMKNVSNFGITKRF